MPIIGELQIKPQAFAAAVAWAAKWVTPKPVVPVHAGLALTAADGALEIRAFNGDVSARATIAVDMDAEAMGAELSTAIVSGRLLAELAGTFGNKQVTITGDDSNVFLRAGRFAVSLPMLDADAFPASPDTPSPIGSAAGDALASAVARTAVAVGKDAAKGLVFASMHIGFGEKEITLLATDRYRAAGVTVPWQPNGDDTSGLSAIVLGHMLKDAAAGFAGPDEITIGLSATAISLTSATRSLTVQLVDLGEATFPVEQFLGYLSAEQDETAVLTVAEMMAPLKRAGLVRGKEGPVRLTFTQDTVTISSKADEIAQEGDEGVDADYAGPETAIAFNPQYFADALGTVPGGTVRMGFGSPKKPITLTVDGDPSWRHILVPVIIR